MGCGFHAGSAGFPRRGRPTVQAKADKPKNKNLPSKQKIKASSAGCFLSPKPREKSFPQVLLTRAPGKMQRATIASVKYRAFLSHVFCDALNCRLRGEGGDQIQSGKSTCMRSPPYGVHVNSSLKIWLHPGTVQPSGNTSGYHTSDSPPTLGNGGPTRFVGR